MIIQIQDLTIRKSEIDNEYSIYHENYGLVGIKQNKSIVYSMDGENFIPIQSLPQIFYDILLESDSEIASEILDHLLDETFEYY